MSKKEQIENRTWELMQPILLDLGLIGVDAEYVKEAGEYALRIYIDKEGGIGIDDCEAFSRAIDPKLDEENFISDPYTLIVSSPGLGRILRRPRDFEFALGKEVELNTYKAANGEKHFRGILKNADDKTVTVEIGGELKEFNRSDLSKIALAVDF